MIQFSAAGKRYGHKLLFEDADWLITPESRIGLVGANGTGKSTIMKILAGSETLDYGSISRAKGISAGYLPQDGLSLTGRSIFAECMSVFDELHAMEKEMESLTRSMSELDHASVEYANVADRYQKLEHEFRARDGYTLEAEVGKVLTGLGFHRDDWTRQTEEFSGGWQMRIALAKLLLQKPNLLLLDEPTNHLDLEARNWLEEYLGSYPYAYVLISHDRYFLDVTVNRIVEIWNKRLHFYAGNYDQYLAAQGPHAKSSSNPLTKPSVTASSSSKSSSTASATRPPRPSKSRAASRNSKRSSASRFPKKKRPSTSPSRSPSPADASSPSLRTSPKVTAITKFSRKSAS